MGIAGRLARSFLASKLTPLVTLASLLVGGVAIVATPREEEPQISVPMIDVIAAMPGAAPEEVENTLTRPIEKRLWEIAGVDHIYSMAGDGMTMVTVRFAVGEDQERSVVKVHAKIAELAGALPPRAMTPMVKPHAIDDVPIVAVTLHARDYSSNELRAMALHLDDELRSLPDVAATSIIGGHPREIRVELDPAKLAARGASPGQVAQALRGAGARLTAGEYATADDIGRITVGAPLTDAADVGAVVVAEAQGLPVYVRDVATVSERYSEPQSYVFHASKGAAEESAVTVAVAKRKGANAAVVADAVLARVEQARGRVLASGVETAVTRNYGATASEKARELILHIAIATISVTLLIWMFLGYREALVVLVAVPVTLAITLFVYYALGYSLNRITLFALIFSIGILVDDAIVVIENMARRMGMGGGTPEQAAIEGVDEVGNPTILATFTVIAAILPMAFVSGLMGPYMRPIPVGASVAMLASLAVAFIVTPWLGYTLLRRHSVHSAPRLVRSERKAGLYERLMNRLMRHAPSRWALYVGVAVLLLGSMSLIATRGVQVKMLPFDNKSEMQVVLDMPEGTSLESSVALATEVATYLRTIPEVQSTEVYAGTAAPFNFNGLVRHYFMRQGANVADIQVNLVDKHARSRQSHAIALAIRPEVARLAGRYGASAKIAEIPPGPPVLSTLVAEVYARDDASRHAAAIAVKEVFETTDGVVDVDWTLEAPQREVHLRIDRVRAAAFGASVQQLVDTVYLAEHGAPVAALSLPSAREPVAIVPRLALRDRSSVEALLTLPVATSRGPLPLGRFASVERGTRPSARFRKDLRPVVYVTGDVAGSIESPVYAILAMNQKLDALRIGDASITRYNAVQPSTMAETALKWDGEWQVTIEVFRDLGAAFAVVLVLIYVLVVGWFQSFKTPLAIMAPIPLTLIGILPGHAASGAFFTATSMIGMIALAGIIVRNSILLVDFIQLAESRGASLEEAVVEAGLVRARPIMLTAAAVVVGGVVMVLDPIFQGLAVALMSGAVVATALTMVIVPLVYWQLSRHGAAKADSTAREQESSSCVIPESSIASPGR